MPENTWKTVDSIPKSFWQELKQAIQKSDGRLVVAVHPFYGDNDFTAWEGILPKNELRELKEGYSKYRVGMQKLLLNSKIPVVILEDALELKTLRRRLGPTKSEHVWVLPTMPSAHFLRLREITGDPVHDVGSHILANRLKEAGVKTVFVAGMYASKTKSLPGSPPDAEIILHEKSWLPKNRRAEGKNWGACAGRLYSDLIKSRQIQKVRLVPNAVFPDKPAYTIRPKPRPVWKRYLRKQKQRVRKLLKR